MSGKRLSLGINVSILIILTIFGVLLLLPLQLLLNTNYYSRNESDNGNDSLENVTTAEIVVIPVDYRKLKRCRKFLYEDRLKSVFRSDYDQNCTYTGYATDDDEEDNDTDEDDTIDTEHVEETKVSKEIVGEDLTECTEESMKDPRMKSVPVAGYILVTILVVSMISALIEVLRIRFAKDKDSSRPGMPGSRKGSTVDFPVQTRFVQRQPMKSQRSFDIQGMHRSAALRLLGARPPPLIRRSSFPTQQAKQNTSSIGGTPTNRMSRRQSDESDEEVGSLINALHHRTRLIRRH